MVTWLVWMKALTQKDNEILSYLKSKEPEGASLGEVATATNLSRQNAFRYLKKLLSKGTVRKDTLRIYHISKIASTVLVSSTLTPKLNSLQSKPSTQTPEPPEQATNLNAFRVHYLIFPTSYGRAKATFDSLKIPYKVSGNPKHPSYTLKWENLSLRIGSKQLIAWGPNITEPISINANDIEGKATQINLNAITRFLAKTNIRCQESINGTLYAQVHYRELAIVNNDGIAKLARKRGYIEIGFDRKTGRCTLWMDASPNPFAIETNRTEIHEELRQWGQAIEDKIISPYKDEMKTRLDIEGLKEISNNIVNAIHEERQWFRHHDEQTVALTKLISILTEKEGGKRAGPALIPTNHRLPARNQAHRQKPLSEYV